MKLARLALSAKPRKRSLLGERSIGLNAIASSSRVLTSAFVTGDGRPRLAPWRQNANGRAYPCPLRRRSRIASAGRAIGEWEVRGVAGAETRFRFRTGITSAVLQRVPRLSRRPVAFLGDTREEPCNTISTWRSSRILTIP